MLRRMTNDPNRSILSRYESFGKEARQTAAENYIILTPDHSSKMKRSCVGAPG